MFSKLSRSCVNAVKLEKLNVPTSLKPWKNWIYTFGTYERGITPSNFILGFKLDIVRRLYV